MHYHYTQINEVENLGSDTFFLVGYVEYNNQKQFFKSVTNKKNGFS